MCRDYSYEYRWDHRYCYPNSNVLINKLNIKNADGLAEAEREITSLKLAMAKADPIKGRLDFAHLQDIHRYIFEDIYSWAGELRQVDISKGNQFCLCQHLQTYGERVFSELRAEQFLIGAADVPYRLAYYLSEINVLHPFREGNGRTQRLFIEYLANVAGYSVDFSKVNSLLTSEPPWVGHQQAVFICLEFMRDQGATLYYVNLDIKVQKLQNERGKSRKP